MIMIIFGIMITLGTMRIMIILLVMIKIVVRIRTSTMLLKTYVRPYVCDAFHASKSWMVYFMENPNPKWMI